MKLKYCLCHSFPVVLQYKSEIINVKLIVILLYNIQNIDQIKARSYIILY